MKFSTAQLNTARLNNNNTDTTTTDDADYNVTHTPVHNAVNNAVNNFVYTDTHNNITNKLNINNKSNNPQLKIRKLNIALPFPYFREGNGGMYIFCTEFAKSASIEGHNITIISTISAQKKGEKKEGEKEIEYKNIDGYTLLRIPFKHSKVLRRIRDYVRFGKLIKPVLKKINADYILGISNAACAGIGFSTVYRSAGGPVSWELKMWQELWKRGFAKQNIFKKFFIRIDFALQKIIEQKCVRNSKALLCQSQDILRGFQKEYDVSGKPAIVPCTGVDVKIYASNKQMRKKMRKQLKIESKQAILFAGGFSIPKGASILEKALPEIFETNPNAVLIIAGTEQYVLKLSQYEKRIIKLGNVNHKQMPAIYNSADIFLYPSVFNEGFPNAVLEAMASQLPIICTQMPGIKEYIIDGKQGIIIERYNSKAITNAVNELLSNSKKAKLLARNARKKVKEYTWRAVTKKILNFMGQLK